MFSLLCLSSASSFKSVFQLSRKMLLLLLLPWLKLLRRLSDPILSNVLDSFVNILLVSTNHNTNNSKDKLLKLLLLSLLLLALKSSALMPVQLLMLCLISKTNNLILKILKEHTFYQPGREYAFWWVQNSVPSSQVSSHLSSPWQLSTPKWAFKDQQT